MNRPAVRDFALLLARFIVGVVFIARGYQHWVGTGMSETAQQFAQAGVPQPRLVAYVAGSVELIGGAMLIIGLLTTIIAGLMAVMVLVAGYFIHLPHGFFAEDGGLEYPLILAVLLGLIFVFGAGRASMDRVLVDG
ncbi:DoxX family protein [Corynebacterium genitalium ATCC 33030]|uniref:DoxX family protein n=1 Tax=Corynebacterium genitalium ATCC 33030 TaxID=585529 RepID=D7WE85_9CORY|nr:MULTISPECIES: DoxX family protein [Corynebacterium]MCQ4618571.1 DoxX family protein [Corynebacterium pseudogenitalium]EFK54439.1 DoxX family protein [Corynebacterium genitalium ATCC 33030]MCQ4619815.1 DoxX family protein [Corynebacterium sp. CCUG 71335]MCQ4623433.1 DoxX family protein [Corynebacterium sp. CCUG 70398]MCQ4625332.1 DoxX family protein [Corynebacterium sp. CCUG 69979]